MSTRLKSKGNILSQSTVGKDGAVMGVTVTRISMNLHTQVLSQACSYTEGKHKTLISKLRFSFTVPILFQ